MKKIFVIMLYFCSIFLSKGQVGQIWQCHTQPTQSSFSNYSSTDYFSVDESNKILNIYFHVIRRSDGTGGLTNTQISNTIQRLFNDYSQYNIQFNELGRGYINNTQFYNDAYSNYNAIIRTNRKPNAINVYFLSPNESLSRAENIPSLAYCIGGVYYGTSVISHEMGHCLGLYHTHSGSGCYDNANCREDINGSNCNTCGDLVCDTPADPCLAGKVGNNCNYMGNDGYQPDVRNIMSYAPPGCLTRFSNGQRKRMHYTIMNNPIFSSVLISISGPSSFYNEATYTVENLPVGSSVQWSSSSNCLRLISGQGTATATFKAIFNTSAVITATISGSTSTSLSTGTITANAAYNGYISFDVWNNSSGGYIGNTATETDILCPNTTYHFHLVNNSGCDLSDLEWTVCPFWTIRYTQNNMISINTNQSAGGWISLKARTCCGTSGTVYSITLASSPNCPNSRFSLSPNPATDAVTLQLMETDEVSGLSVLSTDRSPYEIQLWSGMTMLRSFRTNEPMFQISMAGLPAGLYFVRVIKDGQTYTQKLIKK